jgi:plastocyanin
MHRRRLRTLVLLPAVLAAAVLAAAPPAAAGGGCHRPATEGRGTTLALTELCFSPSVLRVAPGAEVTIVNRDTLTHPLGRPGGEWAWEGNVGDRVTVRVGGDGVYPFFCYAHPGMVAVVVAGDGRGAGTGVAEVADAAVPAAPAGRSGTAAAGSDATGRDLPSFPVAWLVLVALAALVGAAAGTRLRSRGPDTGR